MLLGASSERSEGEFAGVALHIHPMLARAACVLGLALHMHAVGENDNRASSNPVRVKHATDPIPEWMIWNEPGSASVAETVAHCQVMFKMNAAIAHLTMATLREDGTTKIGAPAELMIGRLGPRHVVGKHSMSQTQPAEEALSPLAHERIAHKV